MRRDVKAAVTLDLMRGDLGVHFLSLLWLGS